MNYENEEWRDIMGYEGLYQVSNIGRIKSLTRVDRNNHKHSELIKNLQIDGAGYFNVKLYKNNKETTKHVHTLVLLMFVGKPEKGQECNHKNGNKTDNRIENLEYCTKSENKLHSVYVLGKRQNTKLTTDDVREIKRLYSSGNYTQKELGILYNVVRSNISMIVTQKLWKDIF